jgi:hypothetical protein
VVVVNKYRWLDFFIVLDFFSILFFSHFALICFLYFFGAFLYYFSPLLDFVWFFSFFFLWYLSNIFIVYYMFILFAFPITFSILFYLQSLNLLSCFFYKYGVKGLKLLLWFWSLVFSSNHFILKHCFEIIGEEDMLHGWWL